MTPMILAPPPVPVAVQTRVTRRRTPGLDLTVLTRSAVRELHLTLRPLPGEAPTAMARRLESVLAEHGATVVRHEVFGSLTARTRWFVGGGAPAREWHWPVTWLDGGAGGDAEVAGMHVHAVAGVPVESVFLDGRVVDRMFEDGHARHCLLGDVGPGDAGAPRDVQARQVFERVERALATVDLSMTQVARTWLFLDDILAWYGPLNRVRREFFTERRLFDHVVPASTGIGARNPQGAAMVAGAWAVEATGAGFRVGEVLSPMQCPASEYGSCFSRAVEEVAPDLRRVLISGTASIEPKGSSVCGGDVDGQIDLTLQVVRAMLVSRGMDYPDVTRATVYLRDPADKPVFRRWSERLGLGNWPLVTTPGVVCREELLFEIEVDAHSPTRPASPPPRETGPATLRASAPG